MDYIREYRSFVNSYNLSGALRITFGILFPAVLLSFFGDLSVGIVVSLGAMCVGNTDNPGPIHHRRNGMIACILILFIVTLLTGAASVSYPLMGTLLFLFCFVFSMMSIFGNRAGSIGLNALLVMVLNIDRRHHGLEVLLNALYVSAGGIWYMALSLLLYRVRPYKLVQQAIGDCVQATAGYLRIKASFYDKEADYDKAYRRLVEEQIDVHQKQELVRELLFKSRDIVRESTHIGRVLLMIFLDVVDLFERVMTSHQDYPALHAEFDGTSILEQYRQLILDMATELDGIGIALKSSRPSVDTGHLAARIREVRESFAVFRDERRNAGNVEGFIGLRQILENMEDVADRLHTLHGYTTYDPGLAGADPNRLDYELFVNHQDIDWRLFAGNLNLRSNSFRHALRVSLATLAGYMISRLLGVGHGYWILLTVIVILKPAYSLTKRRNYERLVGTLAGALAGLLIIYYIRDRSALFVLMVVFMIGTYAFLRTNYLVCVILMTPYVLLLFHLLYPNDFRVIISDRVIDTAIGSGIAFLANIFLIPSWEHEQIIPFMVGAIDDNLQYFLDSAGAFRGKQVPLTQYKLSRKRAFVSLANLSDAFNRMLSEPKSKQKNVRKMHQFVVSSHMLTSHIATLSSYAPAVAPAPASPAAIPALPALPAEPDYSLVIRSIGARLREAAENLRQTEPAAGAVSPGLRPEEREGLRMLNERLERMIRERREELEKGIMESPTRRQLSAFKPIADQFNFIAKVSADIGKLSLGFNYSSPASPAASSPVPSW
ncbi:MAG: FUSC family membrane protein [Bacteroidota bacterium]|nr:FUSC family membrane protein [Bacteroidota bacterium]